MNQRSTGVIRTLFFGALLGLLMLSYSLPALAFLGPCESRFVSQSRDGQGERSQHRVREEVISASSRLRVSQWVREERAKVVSADHAASVRTVKGAVSSGDRNGKAIKTKFVVQLIHGLYNSPKWMENLGSYFHASGMNVVNTRLPGHFEKQADALDRVNRKEWVNATESAFQIATELGERVIVVGHSTGGLLASMMAVKHPEKVAAIVLFAPAYRLSTMSWIKAAVSSRANIGYVEEGSGRYISGDAGHQVVMLGKEFWAELAKENSSYPIEVLRDRLRHIPILMIDTALEKTIDSTFNRIVMRELAAGDLSVARNHIVLPEADQTPHHTITLENNGSGAARSFEKVKATLDQFLDLSVLPVLQ